MMRYIGCLDKKKVKGLFIVHGEEETQMHFAERLSNDGWKNIVVPAFREEVEL